MKFISIVNWAKYQHYKDRTPPWIKFYPALLDDYTFVQLPDASKRDLMLLFLVASRHENRIPADEDWLMRVMGLREKPNLEILVSAGFVVMGQDDSKTLSDCKPSRVARARSVSPLSSVSSLSVEGESEGGKAKKKAIAEWATEIRKIWNDWRKAHGGGSCPSAAPSGHGMRSLVALHAKDGFTPAILKRAAERYLSTQDSTEFFYAFGNMWGEKKYFLAFVDDDWTAPLKKKRAKTERDLSKPPPGGWGRKKAKRDAPEETLELVDGPD